MPKLRPSSIDNYHRNLTQACKDWTPDSAETGFSDYIVKHGIDHLFQVGDLDGAREQLLDLHFFGRLYELVEYPQILRYWRTLCDESVADQYQQVALELLGNDDFESIRQAVRSFSWFCVEVYGFQLVLLFLAG